MKLPPEILVICVESGKQAIFISVTLRLTNFTLSLFSLFFFFWCRRKIHPDQKNINAYVVFKDKSAATKALER